MTERQQTPWRRRVALWLLAHATRTLPAARQSWADAMRAEIAHVQSDGEAVRWALGCAWASHVERLRAQPVLDWLAIRIVVVVLLAQCVLNDLYARAVLLAYEMGHLEIAAYLGRLSPNGDYRPFIPLLAAVPVWLHAIWIAGAVAYGVAAVRYVRRSAWPIVPFVTGIAIDTVAWALLQPFESLTRVNGESGAATDILVWCANGLLVVALWKSDARVAADSRPQ